MICDKEKCTGCGGCFNVCPKKAITMSEDLYGNIFPVIDKDKCINCGLCKKICSQLNDNEVFSTPIKCYAMYSKNNSIRENSTSGGVATSLSKLWLEQGGIVYGAGNLLQNKNFEFLRISDINDLEKIQGSKYVHCYINDKYSMIKKDLLNNKRVLFIGTPCQVSGLKNFLCKEYDNLFTIDIVCHGVSSQKLLFDDLDFNNIKKELVYKVSFRDINGFYYKVVDAKGNILLNSHANNNLYYKNYLESNIYRKNCYYCKYAKIERVSDITLGDFWGLSNHSVIYDDFNKGISMVLINNKKADEFIDKYLNYFEYDLRDYKEAQKINKQLNFPSFITKKFFIFEKYYPKYGYSKTMKKMENLLDLLKNIYRKIRYK